MRAFLLPLLIVVSMPAAYAAEVQGIRFWAGPDHTRAVIDVTEEVNYKVFTLDNPHRVVVDIEQTVAQDQPPRQEVDQGVLDTVRTGKRDNGGLRVVFDLKGRANPKSFLLQPAASYGHRLVVDLEPQSNPKAREVKRALPPVANREIVVAIDAGHGGEDPGAIGPAGTREKDVALAIARELKAAVDAEYGMRAILVRDGDYYIPHYDRPQKARDNRADLFVSVHADAFHSPKPRGASVFVLSRGRASSEGAKWLADRENRSDLVGGVKLVDKDETLAAVLLDLSQSASMQASERAAKLVLNRLGQVAHLHKNYVEKASLAVLISPDIPSIFVEAGFISNPKEEKQLKNAKWRRKLAHAITDGIRDYFYAAPPPGTMLASAKGQRSHKVTRGETLSQIAQRHRVSVDQIRAVNRMDTDLLRIGDVLQIPGASL